MHQIQFLKTTYKIKCNLEPNFFLLNLQPDLAIQLSGCETVLARTRLEAPNFPGVREARGTITLPRTCQRGGAEPAAGAGDAACGHTAAKNHALPSETGTPAAVQGSTRSQNRLGSTTSRGEVTPWRFRVFLWLTNFKPNSTEVIFSERI